MKPAWRLLGMMRLGDGHRLSALQRRSGREWKLVLKSDHGQAEVARGPSLGPALVFFAAVHLAVGFGVTIAIDAGSAARPRMAFADAFYADRDGVRFTLGKLACALAFDELAELVSLLRTVVGIDTTELEKLAYLALHHVSPGQVHRPSVGQA